jgi:tetratricopeptide (TPR) repeat protein
MGFSYRKSIRLAPGVRMTFSKSGVGYSAGGRGYRVTKTASGRVTRTVGIPGTGLSHTKTIAGSPTRPAGRGSTPAPRSLVPPTPPRPGMFAPKGEKALYQAISTQNWAALERVIYDHPDHGLLAGALFGSWVATQGNPTRATELLAWVFASGQDPAAHPFTQKYLHSSFSFEVAPGVGVELPVGRDSVGLMLAELHQEAGNLAAAIEVVEHLEPTTYAAVSLAELYSQAGRHADVVEVTEGVSNQDDATALLCVFRGIAFREQGFHEAAREALKEALRSKKRDPVVRHRALLERAKSYLSEGKRPLARKDLERILAEDSDYDGLRELLDTLDDGAATPDPIGSSTRNQVRDDAQKLPQGGPPSTLQSDPVPTPRQPTRQAGLVRGRHYTEWVEPVKQLKREGRLKEAEALLLECVDAVEAQARVEGSPVAPWYYEQLGIVYRKLGDQAASDAIAQRHANAP